MKGKEAIINFLVIIALLGYIVCSFLIIKEAIELSDVTEGVVNAALHNFSTALTGLVGGIVAAAFGVEAKEELEEKENRIEYSKSQLALQNLGGYAIAVDNNERKEKLGNLYAWSYVIVGCISTIIWAYLEFDGKNVTQNIATIGSTFGGMVFAIVGAYLKPTT